MAHVFISYSKKNKTYARQLAEYLKRNGIDVWIDDRIDYGVDWWDAIDRAIAAAGAVIVIMSPDAKNSRWVQREISLAEDRNKPVFPLLLEGENWSLFVRTQYVMVTDGSMPSLDFVEDLKSFVESRAGRGEDVAHAPQAAAARSVHEYQPERPSSRRNWLPFAALVIVVIAIGAFTLPSLLSNRTPTPTRSAARATNTVPINTPVRTPTRTFVPTATTIPPTRTGIATVPAAQPLSTATPNAPTAVLPTINPSGECMAAPSGTTSVNVRMGPGTTYSIRTQIPSLNTARVIGRMADNSWYYVTINGLEGWVAASVIRIGGLCSAVPVVTPSSSQTPIGNSTLTPAPGVTLNFGLPPVYGSTALTSGFVPDPYSVSITAGGPANVSYLGGGCSGFTTSAPSFSINYTRGTFPTLRFYFVGSGDTTLIINSPTGSYYCNDDSFGTLNPTIDFNSAPSGRYDVWIGSYATGSSVSGTLYVTENTGNRP